MILDDCTPRTRSLLVASRIAAMEGRRDEARRPLSAYLDTLEPHARVSDLVAVKLLLAEIAFLDHDYENSIHTLSVAQEEVRGLKAADSIQLILAYNKNEVDTHAFRSGSISEFYALTDRRRTLGIEFYDPKAILAAEDEAGEERHYNALPAFWRELLRSYRQCVWPAARWASRRFGRECVRLGRVDRGLYHAIFACDEGLAAQAVKQIVARQDRESLTSIAGWLQRYANLGMHYTVACHAFDAAGDSLADAVIPDLFNWVRRRVVPVPDSTGSLRVSGASWKVLKSLACRLTLDDVDSLITTVLSNRIWLSNHLERRDLVECLAVNVRRYNPAQIRTIALATIEVLDKGRSAPDYTDVVNLLCLLAKCGGDDVRRLLADRMYQKGKPIDPLLVQAAPSFGVVLGSPVDWEKFVCRAIGNLGHHVQVLPPGQQGVEVQGSYGQFGTVDRESGVTTIVHIAGITDLYAVSANREQIPRRLLDQVYRAAIEKAGDSRNLLVNRASLVAWLPQCKDRVSRQVIEDAVKMLIPVVRGEIREPEVVMGAREARDPLNPFKIDTGSVEELSGVALWALGCLLGKRSRHGNVFGELLLTGLTGNHAPVRHWAARAVSEWGAGSETLRSALLLLTRDSDDETASTACRVIGSMNPRNSHEAQTTLLALRIALTERSPVVRSGAAIAIKALGQRSLRPKVAQDIAELQRIIEHDQCWSVRNAGLEEGGAPSQQLRA